MALQLCRINNEDKAEKMFYNMEDKLQKDELKALSQEMQPQFKNKMEKAKLQIVLSRLKIFDSLNMLKGIRSLMCCLERIKLTKQIMILDLEMGKELEIPEELS